MNSLHDKLASQEAILHDIMNSEEPMSGEYQLNNLSSPLPRFLLRRFLAGTFLVGILLVATAALPLHAQPRQGEQRELLDGVAAVVGNEVILVSEVYGQAQQLAAMRKMQSSEMGDPKFLQTVLDAMINEKLVLARAHEDSIVVQEDELTHLVDRQYASLLERCNGSTECLEKTYRISTEKIKRELRDLLRQQYLGDEVRRRRFSDVKVTENDMQEFFRLYRDSIPEIPEQLELQRIVLINKPGPDAKRTTLELARRIVDSLRKDGDFGDFARRYSADPGSASNGGDVGFVEPGRFVKEYERATKSLAINDISDPVESIYGLHIIQVLERRGEAVHSRHILLSIQAGATERDSLIARLRVIRDSALAGADFAELARRYSQDPDTRGLGGSLGKASLDALPEDQRASIGALKPGDITEPKPVTLSPTDQGFQIIRLARMVPKHSVDLREDRPQLEKLALLYKQNQEYEKWVNGLRGEIYWEIKHRF